MFKTLFQIILFIAISVFSQSVSAEESVALQCGDNAVEMLINKPAGSVPTAAVVYTHGLIVEKIGRRAAAAKGYDVGEFTAAFARAGYLALAPLRDPFTDGVACLGAVLRYLQTVFSIGRERVIVAGFSKGGDVTLEFAINHSGLAGVVLMSPAISTAINAEDVRSVSAPLLVTLGQRDPEMLRSAVLGRLVPALRKQGKMVELYSEFDGDHRWFWKVRPDHWDKVIAFSKRVLPLN